jgi:hypothetical protein
MKLYTKARPVYPHQLRPGDQIAIMAKYGEPLRSEAAFVDADLDELVSWSVVHTTADASTGGFANTLLTKIMHTLGDHDVANSRVVIMREVIEIDPWTYVRSEENKPE